LAMFFTDVIAKSPASLSQDRGAGYCLAPPPQSN
jgi:hypothetical protein